MSPWKLLSNIVGWLLIGLVLGTILSVSIVMIQQLRAPRECAPWHTTPNGECNEPN